MIVRKRFMTSINISSNIIPEFSFPTELCSSNDAFFLPSISDNNIEGTWSVPEIIPNSINGTLISEFIPDANNSCAENLSVTFTI